MPTASLICVLVAIGVALYLLAVRQLSSTSPARTTFREVDFSRTDRNRIRSAASQGTPIDPELVGFALLYAQGELNPKRRKPVWAALWIISLGLICSPFYFIHHSFMIVLAFQILVVVFAIGVYVSVLLERRRYKRYVESHTTPSSDTAPVPLV